MNPVITTWILSALVLGINVLATANTSIPLKIDGAFGFQSNLSNASADGEYQFAPTETIIFNLPIIEQAAPTETPLPESIYPAPGNEVDIITETPTSTPIPVQTGSFNLPIVIGAVGIILVVILAWFFIGYLPMRKSEEPPKNQF